MDGDMLGFGLQLFTGKHGAASCKIRFVMNTRINTGRDNYW